MAVSAIGIAASVAGTYAGTFATGAIAIGLTQGIVGTIVAGALSGLIPDDEQNGDQVTQQASALLNKSSNNAPLPVVYGYRKIGGTRVFMEVSGTDNEFLHVVIAMSEGEINSFENIYINDIIKTDSRFNGLLDVYTHTGADNQTADTQLIANLANFGANWTLAHRLRGTAYLYVKLKFDVDAYPRGLPTITADLKGTKVYDPRAFKTGGSFVTGTTYKIITLGNTTQTQWENAGVIAHNVDEILLNTVYKISSVGTTDFVLIGSANNSVGTIFTATAKGIGTGTLIPIATVGTVFVATSSGAGTGKVNPKVWSDNPVLCIRDYLTNTRYGRGISTSLIDDTAFNLAANHCDTTVNIGGATVKRYTCNGIVNTAQGSIGILKQLLTSCKGFLVFTGGKYKLIIDKIENAGFTFDEDNIVGEWQISLGSKNSQFNRIRANFINKNKQWQPDIAVVESTSLRTLDNGELLEKTTTLPYTTDIDRAKMITTININQSRQRISCVFTATIEALKAEVGDVVYIKHSTVGWQYLNNSAGKKFRIIKMALQNNDEVKVTAVEYAAGSYAFGTIQVSDTAPNTNLPDVSTTKIPINLLVAEQLFVTNTGQGVQVRANLNWTAPTDAFAQYYEVEYAEGSTNAGSFITGQIYTISFVGNTNWTAIGATSATVGVQFSATGVGSGTGIAQIFHFVTQTRATTAEVNNLKAGAFSFRVRTVNTIGVKSAYITANSNLAGLTTPPLTITNFSVNAIDGSAHLQWDRSPDIDVIHGGFLRIRHTPITTGAVWAGGSSLGQALAGTSTNATLPLLAGTYMIKAVDSAGNFANTASLAITTVPNIIDFNVVATDTQSPAFSGQKNNTVKDGNTLVLTNTNNVVATSGSYTFSNYIDLGQVFTSRVTANFVASGFVQVPVGQTDAYIDSRTALIDNWSNFDGEPSDKVVAVLQIRTTQTDPASNPTWTAFQPLVIGDFQARAFEFKVVITSQDSSRNIAITNLGVTIDMPDRNEKASNVTVPTSGLSVSYTNSFKAVPYLGVTIQNSSTGDYWTTSNETVNGFSIVIYNSGGTAIQKNINWMATGFGRKA